MFDIRTKIIIVGFCNPGVTGQRCEACEPLHFGFSNEGCKQCDCDPTGSTNFTCDLVNGQCPCRDKVEGRRCDRCEENTHSKDAGGTLSFHRKFAKGKSGSPINLHEISPHVGFDIFHR